MQVASGSFCFKSIDWLNWSRQPTILDQLHYKQGLNLASSAWSQTCHLSPGTRHLAPEWDLTTFCSLFISSSKKLKFTSRSVFFVAKSIDSHIIAEAYIWSQRVAWSQERNGEKREEQTHFAYRSWWSRPTDGTLITWATGIDASSVVCQSVSGTSASPIKRVNRP